MFPTPHDTVAIYVDADASAPGNGTEARPFHTLEAAVTAAGEPTPGKARKTILMKAGTYHTTGVVLTTKHSGLTIQNYQGAEVIVSGAVPVANSKNKWTLVNAKTNTWKLDTTGQHLQPEFGMRMGTRRAIRAKFPNGDPETAAA